MAADLAAAKAFADGESASISIGATPPSKATWINSQFRSNNALTKVLAIVLSHHQPIDLLTGQQVDTTNALAWNNQQEFHHFFPQDFLKRRGVSRRRQIAALARAGSELVRVTVNNDAAAVAVPNC